MAREMAVKMFCFLATLLYGIKFGNTAVVEIQLKPDKVEIGGKVQIELSSCIPGWNSSAFDRLDCGYKANYSSILTVLAQFDKNNRRFKTPAIGLCPSLSQRVYYNKGASFILQDARPSDESLGFVCVLSFYHQGHLNHVESQRHLIRIIGKKIPTDKKTNGSGNLQAENKFITISMALLGPILFWYRR